LTFTSGPVKGKRMIVQTTNTGGDLGQNHFDIAMPGKYSQVFRNQIDILISLQVVAWVSSTPAQISGVRRLKAGVNNTEEFPLDLPVTVSLRSSRQAATGGLTGLAAPTTRM
jgi:hypothetical protein